MKYYNSGSSLGIVGVSPGHQDGPYTYLLEQTPARMWIRTQDLHETREAAEKASPAVFLDTCAGIVNENP